MGDKVKAVKQQSEPFDPDDLCRRLTALLVEQKSTADKRLEAVKSVAAAEAIDESQYRQVLQEAVSDYNDGSLEYRRTMHKLPEHIMKDKQKLERKLEATKSCQASHAALISNHSIGKRDRLSGRDDMDWNHDLENKNAEDFQRKTYPSSKLAFPAMFKFPRLRDTKRSSVAKDILWESHGPSKGNEKCCPDRRNKPKFFRCIESSSIKQGTTSPLLKRIETNWSSMSKKTPRIQSSVKSVDETIELSPSNLESKRRIRTSIMARFRRQTNK